MKTTVVLLVTGLLLSSGPRVRAQIVANSPGRQRAENRRALRDAEKYPATYKDSHLNVTPAALRRGEPGHAQPRDGRGKYQFDKTGTPRVSEPTAPGARLTRKKQLPT